MDPKVIFLLVISEELINTEVPLFLKIVTVCNLPGSAETQVSE